MRHSLHGALEEVRQLALAGRLRRWRRRPVGYPVAMAHRILYRRRRVTYSVSCSTFFGKRMKLLLPAGMDIYLTGGKAHDSEIRLAEFLIENLREGDTFIDVGAHYGYFTLLGAELVCSSGKVIAFEAASATYRVLAANVGNADNITACHGAVSDQAGNLTFYEFPNLYSEYNSMHVEQYQEEDWYEDNQPEKVTIPAVKLDDFLRGNSLSPAIIKIDVEGAEYEVVSGAREHLTTQSPTLVMEYLNEARGNQPHSQALLLLRELGYKSFIITPGGELTAIENVDTYLYERNLESDNIVFRKPS